MTELDQLAREYVELTLTKHQYHDVWDVYWFADTPFWKRTDLYVNRDEPVYPYKPAPRMPEMSLSDILVRSNNLYERALAMGGTLNGNDEIRRIYLVEHVRSLIVRTRFLSGEKMTYDEYTSDMFGLTAPESDLSQLDSALKELDMVLPGKGDIGERIRNYKESIRIPSDRLPAVMNRAAEFFHKMTVKNMGTKDSNMPRLRYRKIGDKNVFVTVLYGYDYDEVTLEQNFSTEFPFYLDTIAEVAGHELEPGHFTFMYLRTKGMVDTCYPELGLNSHGPSSALIEGGARAAIALCLDTPDKEREFDLEMFDLAGIDKALADCLPAWRSFLEASSDGKLEIERNLWNKVWTLGDAAQFARAKFMITGDQPDEAAMPFIGDPGHFTSHDYCTKVVKAYYGKRYTVENEKWQAYKQLCQYPFSMKGIVDGTFDPNKFRI